MGMPFSLSACPSDLAYAAIPPQPGNGRTDNAVVLSVLRPSPSQRRCASALRPPHADVCSLVVTFQASHDHLRTNDGLSMFKSYPWVHHVVHFRPHPLCLSTARRFPDTALTPHANRPLPPASASLHAPLGSNDANLK